jgi:histidine triad (HIT) family protein
MIAAAIIGEANGHSTLTSPSMNSDLASSDAVCPFCVIAGGTDNPCVDSKQSDVFYRDADVVAFISAGWWPNNPGSVLIIPTAHYSNIYDIPPAAYAAVNEAGRRLAPIMKREYGCGGVSFRQHNEAAGGQSVDHYHLWVFPRFQNDRLYQLYSEGSLVSVALRNQYARRLERCFRSVQF